MEIVSEIEGQSRDSIWGHILEELTYRGLEVDILSEGLLSFPIN